MTRVRDAVVVGMTEAGTVRHLDGVVVIVPMRVLAGMVMRLPVPLVQVDVGEPAARVPVDEERRFRNGSAEEECRGDERRDARPPHHAPPGR